MSASLTTQIVFSLPHDPLTPLDPNNAPTPQAIRLLSRECYANVRVVDTSLGGGIHGHLGLLMPDAQYAIAAPGTAYALPNRPAVPVYTGMSSIQRDTAKDAYKEQQRIYNEAHSMHNQIKKLLIAAIPKIYIDVLADDLQGFALVSARTIFAHVVDTYGKISNADLERNLKELKKPWDPSTPIESIFNNATRCVQFAQAGGEPIPTNMMLRKLINVLTNSGLFTVAIHEWEQQDDIDKTEPNFRTHFTQADAERRINNVSFKTVLTANTATSNNKTTETAKPNLVTNDAGIPYCWTHGMSSNSAHTSATCAKPAPGHICDATAFNVKGGNNTIRRRNREKPVYAPPKCTANKAQGKGNTKNEATEANDE